MIAKAFETSTYDLRTLAKKAASAESVCVCWQHYREVHEGADVLEWPNLKLSRGLDWEEHPGTIPRCIVSIISTIAVRKNETPSEEKC